jgi:hypothetical protein
MREEAAGGFPPAASHSEESPAISNFIVFSQIVFSTPSPLLTIAERVMAAEPLNTFVMLLLSYQLFDEKPLFC